MSDVGEARWIGVDLDGTLAYYDRWRGIGHIGPPVPAMRSRVIAWCESGHRVKIFTARVARAEPEAGEVAVMIQDWLEHFGMPRLEVTAVKDMHCVAIWDDRAVGVVPNTGMPVAELGI